MLRHFRAIIVLSLSGTSLFGQYKDAQIYSSENEHFEIVSYDPISLSWMQHLSKVIAADIIHLAGFDESAIERKIIVELIPSESNHSLPHYRISLDSRGYHKLRMKWSEQLTIDVAIQALCKVYLQRYRYNTLGLEQTSQSIRWLQTAIQQWLYLRRFPTERLTFDQTLQQAPNYNLEESLTVSVQSSKFQHSGWECLALLELIRQRSPSKKSFQKTLIPFLGTRPLKPMLETIFPDLSNQALDKWWIAKREEVAITAFYLCESIEVSRSGLIELATFQTLSDPPQKLIDLNQLWHEREQPLRQSHLRARSIILQRRLKMINPAYFNAARALKAMFRSVLNQDTKIEFTHHLLEFQLLMDDTESMQDHIQQRLRSIPIQRNTKIKKHQ